MWAVPFVEVHDVIGSTNDRAAELARSGAPPGTVVLADAQSAGRGRRGAVWQSASDAGLWMSIILEPARAAPTLPLLVGLACAEGIEAAVGSALVPIGVKWPNDLIVDDRKVGGILCEAGAHGVVVGIGINVRAPAGGFDGALAGIATALEIEVHKSMQRMDVARNVIDRIVRPSPGDWAAAHATFATRDALIGRTVDTESAGGGVARGVDAAGALILERPDGSRVTVQSGSVRLAAKPGNAHHPSASGPARRGGPKRGE
jgi:BirA family biotin operon repressor/biotin-[acetyl-CoA-carboxylase] ligase